MSSGRFPLRQILCRLGSSTRKGPLSRYRRLISHTTFNTMSASSRASLGHEERTLSEPRQDEIHQVIIRKIERPNDDVRVIQLGVTYGKTIKFLPGQWLDVFTSLEHRPGGFTITSTPAEAKPDQSQPRRENAIHDPRYDSYLELAIQKSPNNPPAAWLWRTPGEMIGKPLFVRVGGSFVWPPRAVDMKKIDRIVFVGGGVGINPLISMVAHLASNPSSNRPHIHFLYTARDSYPNSPERALFLHRLQYCLSLYKNSTLDLYLTPVPVPIPTLLSDNQTPPTAAQQIEPANPLLQKRRILHSDLLNALGPEHKRAGTVVYVCGPPKMTDEFVEVMRRAEGMSEERVLCEKWW